MIPSALAAALAVFDEGTLTLLASKGLYRRAARDLAEGRVALSAVTADGAVVLADGETVRIGREGPAAAHCTCPAPGVCRHRIATVLLLQAEPRESEGTSPATVDWPGEVGGVALDALRRWAGKAAWRAALELAEGVATVALDGAALAIGLGPEQVEVRFLAGQGPDGLVSKASPARRKAAHAAAWLVARRHFGLPPPEAEEAVVEKPGAARPPDPAFLAEIRAALADCAGSGLNIAPLAVEERLFTLSVSSRGDALPRLSALLRTIASQIRERRERAFAFDPDRCLALIAEADALARALGSCRDMACRVALNGTVRQDFVDIGPHALTGMGADVWRTEAGARGVTGYFYDPAGDRWFTATVARGAGQDPRFDPANAYRQEPFWGAGPLSTLTKTSVEFDRVLASADGRLSTAAEMRAGVIALRADPASWPTCFDDWGALRDRLRQRLVGGLTSRRPAMEPVILRPRRLSAPSFDDYAQTLRWPAEDRNGQWIELTLAHGRDGTTQMQAMSSFEARGWSGYVIALATMGSRMFRLRPFALFDDDGVHNLGLAPLAPSLAAKGRSPATRMLDRAREAVRPSPRHFGRPDRTRTETLLDDAWSSLMALAEVGRLMPSTEQAATLAKIAADLARIGLEAVSRSISAVGDAGREEAAQAILAACHLIQRVRRQRMDVPRLILFR